MAQTCPQCHAENTDTQRFCGECGAPLGAEGIQVSQTLTIEPPREELTAGTVFAGRYRIVEELGRGGMGRVYRALDQKINEEVALKLIKPEIASEPRTLERFGNELKIARKIAHKNVGKMFHLSEDQGTHYITMEYIRGEDLKRMIHMSKQLSVGTAVGIARQVAEGLAEAHRLGIVHRDLKPGNIMIDREGDSRIMDFGIARLLGDKGITGAGVAVGTPDYMSPEQFEGKTIDGRADLYSLGIILYEMLTGRVPFEGDAALAVAYKHKHERPPDPRELNPQVPEELGGLILKCLEKEPDRRWQTAEELGGELAKIEKGLPTTAATTRAPLTKRTPLTSREITIKFTAKKLLVPGLPILAGIAAVILAVIFLPRRPPPQKPALVHKQITFTGTAETPALSPDGKFLAYAEHFSGIEYKVMVQDLAGGQILEVSRGRNIGGLRWSPDGSELVFYGQKNDGSWTTSIVPRLGGRPRLFDGIYYPAWSPDGSQIATWSDEKKQLIFTNKNTGESRSLAFEKVLPPYAEDLDWSPSGKFLALSMYDDDGAYSIWTVTVDGRLQNKIIADPVNSVGSPRWSARENGIYYLRYRDQTADIWKIPVSPETGKSAGQPRAILEGHQVGSYFTLAGNGKHLAYTREVYYSNLWSATFDSQAKDRKVSVKQLTTGTLRTMAPCVSPDGKMVAVGRGSNTMNIFILPISGGPLQQITFLNSWNYGPAWSPDGTEIAFGSNEGDAGLIWKVNAAGGTPHPFGKAKGYWPVWAPGPKILYGGPSGPLALMAIDATTGETAPVLRARSDAMVFPAWSPDGKKIAIRQKNDGEAGMGLWTFSIDSSSELLLRKGNAIPVCWSADGEWVFASEQVSGGFDILKISSRTGQTEILFNVPLSPEMGNLMMRPHSVDGRHFVFEGSRTQSDVWLMENFDPEIR